MAKTTFIERKFSAGSLGLIKQANVIIEEYVAMGFVLTLRQLFYQFVARGIIPNKQTEYKRLGSIINDARLAGLVDWGALEDRTRFMRNHSAWGKPQDILESCVHSFKLDPWVGQLWRPEVWIEKDALVGVIEPVCDRWRIPYFACRGYTSQSAQYTAGRRFATHMRNRQKPIVFHLGDHDPSGIDMTRDNSERIAMFARCGVEVRRLALNMDQVEEYNPPPNPAKETDSRCAGYKELYGDESWELDALQPDVIDGLIETQVKELVDQEEWDEVIEREGRNKEELALIRDNYDDVVSRLRDQE